LLFLVGCNDKPGAVKGLITWQYNKFVGTKPDVGSIVYLLPDNPGQNKISDDDASSYFLGTKIPENYYYAKVNGNGNYEIQNIKPGKYKAIIVSNNTNRDIVNDSYAKFFKENILTKYFSPQKSDVFDSIILYIHKFETKDIEIKPGSSIDLSHDFGNTYI